MTPEATSCMVVLQAADLVKEAGCSRELTRHMADALEESLNNNTALVVEFKLDELKPNTNPCHATADDIAVNYADIILDHSQIAYIEVGGYKRYLKNRFEDLAA